MFGGLFAINIALYISLNGLAPQVYYLGDDPTQLFAVIEYAAVFIGLPIATIFILPIWMLESSRLMCLRKIELYNRPVSPDIEGVGEFYIKLLKV